MANKLPEIFIIRDSREHLDHGWVFEEEEKKPGKIRICGTIDQGLDCADYSIKGLEDVIRVERKMGFRELFGNYTPSANQERFHREMEKLRPIKHKFILIETFLTEDSLCLSIPQSGFGPPCHKILDWLTEIELEYNIGVKFVGDAGKRVAKTIFRQIARKYL
jgi:hypothetical protein